MSPIGCSSISHGGLSSVDVDEFTTILREKAVVILGAKSCCLCYTITTLLSNLGVSPTLVEMDELMDMSFLMDVLAQRGRGRQRGSSMSKGMGMSTRITTGSDSSSNAPPSLPMVFIGGEFIGGLCELFTAHIRGTLVPQLKVVGALWL